MCAFNLPNPALGKSLWPICRPFRITVFLPHRTSAQPQECNTERSIPASKLHGPIERDHNGSRSTRLTCRESQGTIRNSNLFRHGKIDVTAAPRKVCRWNPALILHQ